MLRSLFSSGRFGQLEPPRAFGHHGIIAGTTRYAIRRSSTAIGWVRFHARRSPQGFRGALAEPPAVYRLAPQRVTGHLAGVEA
ncbi:MAG: hypothetical protein ABSC31_14815 [Acidimicrobiales bacterium]